MMTSKEKLALIKETWYDVDLTDEKYIDFDEEQTFNDLEKDLEDYEEIKNLMGIPIQDIMKRLKILDILKNIIVVVPNTIDTAGPKYYIKLRQDVMLNDETKKIIKEWLDEK